MIANGYHVPRVTHTGGNNLLPANPLADQR
jgi:hypothetical protein